MQKVVLYKANAQLGGSKLARTHGTPANPTFLLLDPEGELLGKWSGYDKSSFITSLNQTLEKARG